MKQENLLSFMSSDAELIANCPGVSPPRNRLPERRQLERVDGSPASAQAPAKVEQISVSLALQSKRDDCEDAEV
jgi:hypothetical protein